MTLLENPTYLSDIARIRSLPLPWDSLKDASFMISGASGMIGSFLIDMLLSDPESNCTIYALGRSKEKLQKRFNSFSNCTRFHILECDINDSIPEIDGKLDYIIHAASNTHPLAYSTDPIGTVTTNIIGTNLLLRYGAKHSIKRFLFCSSVEIYGENKGDTDAFTEDYLGYIDCNTMRAGYPESKRAGEALCQAYRKQHKMDIVIPRLSRTFGPSMLTSDTKAISQFIKKGVAREDIVLKSEGTQFYSYSYVADAVSGLLYCLLLGTDGEAYNISDPSCDISLRDLATSIATQVGTQVVFELPDQKEAAGYSKATKAILCNNKIKTLGYRALFSMDEGLHHTIDIFREISHE